MKLPVLTVMYEFNSASLTISKVCNIHVIGGLWNAVTATLDMGGKAFGLFLKSQRTWKSKPLESKDVTQFKKTLLVSATLPFSLNSSLRPENIHSIW